MGRKRSKKTKSTKVAGVEVVRMPLAEVVPSDYNPRTIDESALTGLARSVEEFGYVEPLVLNRRSGRLVSGHQRLKVLARQGVDEVDVVVVDLDDARERALNVAMNNEALQGEWDVGALREVLGGLREGDVADGLFGGLRMDALMEGLGKDEVKLPSGHQKIPSLESEKLIEIRCTDEAFSRMESILKEWSEMKGVSIDIA